MLTSENLLDHFFIFLFLLKINLDKGTKEMCDVCMKFDSESSNSDFQETGILVNLTHMLLNFKMFF